ncbi:MAG: polyphosphate polymerase domain-containing protein [Balneolaceae bacterium]
MSKDKLQEQRFELKYIISEQKAQSMRYFVQNYLTIDAYGATQPRRSYPVHSLYLDSPSFQTYQDTINGNRNRYKLRVRHYEGDKKGSVFLEMKRRYDRVISKKRAEIPREHLEDIMYGHLPTMDHLVQKTDKQLDSLRYICRLINMLNAKPQVHVAYYREAYELENSNSVRITFDRDVRTEYVKNLRLSTDLAKPISVFRNNVILELKFTNRYPHWMNEMIQIFELRRESAAKYVDGLNRMNHQNTLA